MEMNSNLFSRIVCSFWFGDLLPILRMVNHYEKPSFAEYVVIFFQAPWASLSHGIQMIQKMLKVRF